MGAPLLLILGGIALAAFGLHEGSTGLVAAGAGAVLAGIPFGILVAKAAGWIGGSPSRALVAQGGGTTLHREGPGRLDLRIAGLMMQEAILFDGAARELTARLFVFGIPAGVQRRKASEFRDLHYEAQSDDEEARMFEDQTLAARFRKRREVKTRWRMELVPRGGGPRWTLLRMVSTDSGYGRARETFNRFHETIRHWMQLPLTPGIKKQKDPEQE